MVVFGVWTKCPLVGLAVALAAGCVPYRGQANPLVSAPNDYAGAMIFAATGVAAAKAHRSAVGGCYSQCATGYSCNAQSGFCEPKPACPVALSEVDDPECLAKAKRTAERAPVSDSTPPADSDNPETAAPPEPPPGDSHSPVFIPWRVD